MLLDLFHHGLSRGRSSLALPALVTSLALLLCGGAAEAARADDAQVTVVNPSGDQQTLSLAALAGGEDVVGRSYTVSSATGEGEQVLSGFSLAAILAAAGADPYGFSYLEAQRPAGGSVLLSRHQALDPGAFEDGPPLVYATATGTGFLRPSAGAGDANGADSFEAPQGIALVLRKDSPLLVEAEASTERTRPGQPVEFSATVERAGAGEQLTYSWYFDDGHSASGATASHSFAKRGSYDVVVGVTTPGDRAGASAVVTIQVGAPLSGPDRKGGGHARDADAPDHGAAAGTLGAVPPGPGSAAPVPPAASPPADPPPAEKTKRRQPPPPAPQGEQVSGLLLESPSDPQPAELAAARTGSLDEGSGGPGLSAGALGLLVTVGLLGLGAFAELRGGFSSLSDVKPPRGVA